MVVHMQMTATGNLTDTPPFKARVNASKVDPNPGPSQFLAGLQKANDIFSAASNPKTLKIMVVITDGQFADPSTVSSFSPLLASLRSQEVRRALEPPWHHYSSRMTLFFGG